MTTTTHDKAADQISVNGFALPGLCRRRGYYLWENVERIIEAGSGLFPVNPELVKYCP